MTDSTGTLVPFNYGDAQVRVVTIEGEPWFVLNDLCAILEIANARNASARLADDMKDVRPVDTPGGRQNLTVVSEPGMYEVVIRSDKSEAAAFRRWLTGTVLPEIRRTGSYGTPVFDPASLSRQEILRLALNAEEERLALEVKNQELAPKAEAYDDFLDATGKYNVGVLIGKGAMRNTPYQKYMHHFEVLPHNYEKSDGTQGTSYTTYVQPSGIAFIQRKLGLLAIDPLPASESAVA